MKRLKAVMVDLDAKPMEPAIALLPYVKQRLSEEGVDFVFEECKTKEDLAKYAGDADVVWVASGRRIVTAENIDVLKKCGAIVRLGLGFENIPVEAATERNILVVTTPEIVGPVAEHAIALLFCATRQIAHHDRRVRSGQWKRAVVPPGHLFAGSTLGLVGFGRIPKAVVSKLSGFGMSFIAYDPYVDAETMETCGVEKVDLDQVLEKADFVSLHCALTEETRHLIGERELKLMGSETVLINTARGDVVDEEALCKALKEGWIASAGLDVMSEEPPDPDNELLQQPNVTVTPHMAGYMHLFPKLQFDGSMDKIIELAHGRWPKSVVNRATVTPRWDLR